LLVLDNDLNPFSAFKELGLFLISRLNFLSYSFQPMVLSLTNSLKRALLGAKSLIRFSIMRHTLVLKGYCFILHLDWRICD
jgi:hypothetical protein